MAFCVPTGARSESACPAPAPVEGGAPSCTAPPSLGHLGCGGGSRGWKVGHGPLGYERKGKRGMPTRTWANGTGVGPPGLRVTWSF